jgi:hypothetical protein
VDLLEETPGVTVYGITDWRRVEQRVPTCAFILKGKSPRQVAEELSEANIYVWDGNYYALEVTTRLGLEDSGGMVRVGPVPLSLGLQYDGGDQEVWGGVGEDRKQRMLMEWLTCSRFLQDNDHLIHETLQRAAANLRQKRSGETSFRLAGMR